MSAAAWSRESCVEAVRAFADRNGYQPVSSEANRFNRLPSYAVAARLFGSWNALITAAGFRPYPARSSAQAKTLAHRDRRASVSRTKDNE
jgi:hypothetical protein